MKKYILVFISLLLLMPLLALAQTETVAETSAEIAVESGVTLEDLEVSDPGILPTSNFYFFKEALRGLRRAVTFNAVSRAELELKIVNEKAAELKKVSENNTDEKGLERAIANYKDNAERLRTRLEALKDTSENPNIDAFLDKLTDKTIKHIQLFEELKNKHENIQERLEEAQGGLDGAIAEVPGRLDNLEKFKKRVEKAAEKQRDKATKEIRTIGVLDRLEDKIKNDEAREKISEVKTELVRKFEVRVKASGISPQSVSQILERLPVGEANKLRILEQLKERSENPEVKIRLEGAKLRIEEVAKEREKEREAKKEGEGRIKEVVENQRERQREMNDKEVKAERPQICTKEYNPVCGVNGKTYGNACEARVSGVVVKSKGECQAAGTRTENKPAPTIAPTNLLPKTIIPELKLEIPELKVEIPTVTAVPVSRKWSVEVKDGLFIPSELKIKKGDTVTWTNRDSSQTWPASAIHPTHSVYTGFDALRGLGTGESYSFTFDKVGSWRYHDHLNPSVGGAVEVTE